MELTSSEIRILSALSFNSEEIQNGNLTDKELSLLNEMRAVEKQLSFKYPSYTFEVTGCEPMEGTARDYNEWFYRPAGSENESAYIARTRMADNVLLITDDFYAVVIRDAILSELGKIVTGAGFPLIQSNIGFWEFFGKEYGENLPPMDVLTGKINAGNDIKLFLDGSNLKQSSYETAVKELEGSLKKSSVTGDIYVIILKNAQGDPAKDRVYSDSFSLER
ncbi:hypothetical protein [Butyrivibrio sp. MC2021]|uniref:hypothetical protein n=1 Tax=Butyrivibrio sp. MC2021 TaxID=1408306 RepID=UPI00047954B9|nr:hypothetical protein [Butyrivibrio sp. MC2021]